MRGSQPSILVRTFSLFTTQVDGKAGEEVVSRLGDLGRYIVEFSFGDIYSREGLSLRDRQIATMAMLTALGGENPNCDCTLGLP